MKARMRIWLLAALALAAGCSWSARPYANDPLIRQGTLTEPRSTRFDRLFHPADWFTDDDSTSPTSPE